MFQRKTLWIFLALFATLFFFERPASWLFDPDEARYMEIPIEMLSSGDFLTPRLNGSNYFEKPPLLYWLNAAALKIGGATPYMARLTARLATLATAGLLLLMWSGGASNIPLWAALVYLSSLLPFALGRLNTIDPLITFTVTLTLLSFRSFLRARESGESASTALTLFGMGLALGMLAKGLIGIVLPGMVIFFWCAATSSWNRLRELIFSRATLLLFMVAAPWFVLMEKMYSGFNYFFFVHEHFLRFATASANRPGSSGFFIPVVVLGLLPWTLFLRLPIKALWEDRAQHFANTRDQLFFGIWFAVIFGFFSLSQSKLIPYLLPAFPAAAALVALSVTPRHHKMIQRMLIGTAALFAVLIMGQPLLAHRRSLHDIAFEAVRVHAKWIVAYKTYPQSLPIEAGHPIVVAGYQGELASDDVLNPHLYWTPTHFRHAWSSDEKVVAVFRKEEWTRLPKNKQRYIVFQQYDYVVVANFNPAQ